MAAHDNLHIVREIFAAWNTHDVEGFIKRLDPKTTWESDAFPTPFSGHDGARQFFKLYVTAFPDLHFDIEQILPAGDTHVVVRWRSKGTHHGPLGNILANPSNSKQPRLHPHGDEEREGSAGVGLLRQRAPTPPDRRSAGALMRGSAAARHAHLAGPKGT